MSMKLELSADEQLLVVRASGQFSLAEAKQRFIEVLEAVAQHGVRKVLVDGRKLVGSPTKMERFYYAEHAALSIAKYGVPPNTQFAYVLKEPMRDPERFGETVAVNRGMLTGTFESIDDALVWLGIGSADAPELGEG